MAAGLPRFADVHGGGESAYRGLIDSGGRAQLRNGCHDVFASVAGVVRALKTSLESEYDVVIPAPTLRGQVALDKAVVRLAAGLLASAEVVQAVSEEVDTIAFGPDGRIDIADLPTPSGLLRIRKDVGGPPTQSAV